MESYSNLRLFDPVLKAFKLKALEFLHSNDIFKSIKIAQNGLVSDTQKLFHTKSRPQNPMS